MSDYGEMIYNVTRDIARWDLKRNGNDVTDDLIEDWIQGVQMFGTIGSFEKICKEYWAEYHEYERTRSSSN